MRSQTKAQPGTKFHQFIKVWWMILWRTMFALTLSGPQGLERVNFFTVVTLAALASALLVFVFSSTLRIFPLFQLVMFRFPIQRIAKTYTEYADAFPHKKKKLYQPRTSGSYDPHRNGYSPAIPPVRTVTKPKLKKASQSGTMTGFEPRVLAQMELQRSPWIIGDPGFGLGASGFAAESVKSGQQGETNFAKALQKTGYIDRFQSFWSASVPDRTALIPSRTHDSDIDCILFNGRTVYLVDLKNYKGGDVTYRMRSGQLVCIDNATGDEIQVSGKMGRNMEMALELMRTHLRNTEYRVEAYVVFMPTDSGVGRIQNVRWPGNIPAVYLPEFLNTLKATPHFYTHADHSRMSRQLAGLVKR